MQKECRRISILDTSFINIWRRKNYDKVNGAVNNKGGSKLKRSKKLFYIILLFRDCQCHD